LRSSHPPQKIPFYPFFNPLRRKKYSLRTALVTDAHPSKFSCAGNEKAMRTRLKTNSSNSFAFPGETGIKIVPVH
jgi:hypothetical protein